MGNRNLSRPSAARCRTVSSYDTNTQKVVTWVAISAEVARTILAATNSPGAPVSAHAM